MKNETHESLERIRNGEHALLAQCITRLESSKHEDMSFSRALMETVGDCPNTSMRLAITGTPGAGKSTFIERLCLHLYEEKPQRIAILTVDPSSSLTGGSILGDRIRMEKIANHPEIFVRTSPARDFLGGIGVATREALLLCEATGYQTVILETVGTGQSEKGVVSMVDFVILLLTPAGGDDLQGIKKGILEHVDLIAVNKADGVLRDLAQTTEHFYQDATTMGLSEKKKPVFSCSAKKDRGIKEILLQIKNAWNNMKKDATIQNKRQAQQIQWMKEIATRTLCQQLTSHLQMPVSSSLKKQLQQGKITPYQAAERLLRELHKHVSAS